VEKLKPRYVKNVLSLIVLIINSIKRRRKMKLLTKDILNKFKKQGYTGEKEIEDITVICKFFNPCGAGTWYCYEYDEEYKEFMAFCNLGDPQMAELGRVSLTELESLKCPPFGLPIERDKYFSPKPLNEIMKTIKEGGHV
jgi:hypothetical protein